MGRRSAARPRGWVEPSLEWCKQRQMQPLIGELPKPHRDFYWLPEYADVRAAES